MSEEGVTRRLAAILSADVAGYSRLMADDEDATVRTVTVYRETVDLLVGQHRGWLVDFTGDNFLAEFPTALDAVQGGLELQRVLAARNAELPPERRMHFRMGIHLGEVRVEGGRLFGTGVNVAARLEALAEPGGVCISAAVHAQLRGKLDVACEDLGEHQVKNIPEPVRVYRVPLDRAAFAAEASPHVWRRAPMAAGALVVLSIVILASIALHVWRTPMPVAERKLPTSLLVLPFDDLSPEGDQEYFAHGMSEELTNVLSQTPTLRILGRTTAQAVKRRSLTFAEIGQELGVEAFIEGSVRRSGNRLRITAQLIAVEDGFHLWSETYERPMADVFALQDEVAREVATALEVELVGRPERPPTESLEAYESHLRGRLAYSKGTEEAMRAAIPALEQALSLDPEYVDGLTTLGFLHQALRGMTYDYSEDNLRRAEQLARRALEIDDQNSDAHAILGTVHEANYDLRAAAVEFQLAIERQPGNAFVHMRLGHLRVALGDVESGLRLLDKAVSLDPLGFYGLAVAGYTHSRVGDKQRAIRLLENAVEVEPRNPNGYSALAEAYDRVGREAEALEAVLGFGRSCACFPPDGERRMRTAFGERGIEGVWGALLEVLQADSRLECRYIPLWGVIFLTRLERYEEALRCIEESAEQGTLHLRAYLKVDPLFDPVRDDTRFQVALEKMGLAN